MEIAPGPDETPGEPPIVPPELDMVDMEGTFRELGLYLRRVSELSYGGHTSEEIGRRLHVPARSVDGFMKRIADKYRLKHHGNMENGDESLVVRGYCAWLGANTQGEGVHES
ncbi:MAG: hypothetical protein EXR92_00165 [Gemmatimonadetes bacterium]|nr:hypothetical protein [Gemmatimonadota bacterium]